MLHLVTIVGRGCRVSARSKIEDLLNPPAQLYKAKDIPLSAHIPQPAQLSFGNFKERHQPHPYPGVDIKHDFGSGLYFVEIFLQH